jgi:uncharacterized protein (UPF0264 family)
MTGLLVSVRSAAEAVVALAAGVDLLDVKEPLRGSLGKADDDVIADVVRTVAGRVPVSAALGELLDASDHAAPPGVSFIKFGLSDCWATRDWQDRWAAAVRCLPRRLVPVAVSYADWKTSGAPPPQEVLGHGARLGCGAALLDTYEKRSGRLFDHCSDAEVADWTTQARRLGMQTVVAGSLTTQTIARAVALKPDYIAVRGAACCNGRGGQIDADCIAALREHLGTPNARLAAITP